MTTGLAALVRHYHPECGVNTCTISAAMLRGYTLVAAESLVHGEPGCLPDLERELETYQGQRGPLLYEDELEMQRQAFLAEAKPRTCTHCRSALYSEGPCGSCGKEVL